MVLKGFSKQDHTAISTLGLEFAVAEILGCGLGMWLDKKWGTLPWCLIAGTCAGFALGFYMVWRTAQNLEHNEKTHKRTDKK